MPVQSFSTTRLRQSTRSEDRIECRALTLRDVRSVAPIPSGYATDRVYRLECKGIREGVRWTLREKRLALPYRKQYDGGHVDEWLQSYEDAGAPSELRFLGAGRGGRIDSLMTWRPVTWNETAWLVDIRVREEERGQGLGSALVAHLKDLARAERARGITVETQISNYPAVRFYRSQGFQISGFNDHVYANDDLERQDVALYLFLELDVAE